MPWISDRTWHGGNLLGEGQFALFNPFSLALYAVVSLIPDKAFAALMFSGFHILVLSAGTYFFVINLGGRAALAAVAGFACATTSTMSYWYAAAWWNALVTDAWLMVSLAFWALFLAKGRGFVAAICFGALSMMSGWPHGWIALGILIGIFSFAAYQSGDRKKSILILCGGIFTLLLASPAIAPLLDNAVLSERPSKVANDGDMIGTLEAIVALSWPAYLPQIHRIYGWIAEAPTSFAAWFVLPSLLACRHQLWRRRREPAIFAISVGVSVFILLSLGPQNLYFLRWPMRFISYYQVLLIVLATLLLSHKDACTEVSGSGRVLGLYAITMIYIGFSSNPQQISSLSSLAFVSVLALEFFRRQCLQKRLLTAWGSLLITTAALFSLIHMLWPHHPNLPEWPGPDSVQGTPTMAGAAYTENTMMIHRLVGEVGTSSLPSGAITLWTNARSINGYSAVPNAGIKKATCFNVWGFSCRNALELLFEVPVAGIPLRRDQLFNLRRLAIEKRQFKQPPNWPAEWRQVGEDSSVLVFERTSPPASQSGSVTWAEAPLSISASAPNTSAMHESLQVENTSDKLLRIVFSRPTYSGVGISLNGTPLPIEPVDGVFLSTQIPPHAAGTLEVTYSPPFLRLTAVLAALALIAAFTIQRRIKCGHDI